jgi:drug/metabolite transporter (DMT)-like permease
LAQGQITGGLASFINATTPLWTVIAAHMFTRDERVTGAKMLGLTLGFSGVALIAGGGRGGDFWAIMACLAAALSYGLAAVWGRRFRAMGLAPVQVAFGMLSASTVIILPFWVLGDMPWAMARPPMKPVLAVAALAFFCTALAYILYFRLLALAGATMLSLVTFVIPAFAMGLGALVLGERVARLDLAGLGLILQGLAAMDGRVWQFIKAGGGKA